MLVKLIRTSILCIRSSGYSLILLRPHADECDRAAKRAEGDKSHRTNTLEQLKTKAVSRRVGGGVQSQSSSTPAFGCPEVHHERSQNKQK